MILKGPWMPSVPVCVSKAVVCALVQALSAGLCPVFQHFQLRENVNEYS